MPKDALRLLLGPSVWVLAAHVLQRGSLVVAAIIAARGLAPDQFASYGYFQLTAATAATFASFGLGVSAARHFAEIVRDDAGRIFPLGTLWLASVASAISVGVALLLVPASWVGASAEIPTVWMALASAAAVMNIVPAGAMVGLRMYRRIVVNASCATAVLLGCMGVATARQSVSLACVALVACFVVQTILDAWSVYWHVGPARLRRSARLDLRSLAAVADSAGPLFLVSLLSAAGMWVLGRLVLDADPSRYQFALYTIGMQWFALVSLVPGILAKVSLPLMVHRQIGASGSPSVLPAAVLLCLAGSATASLVVLVGTPWLEALYAGRYHLERDLLLVFLAAAVAGAPANILGNQLVVVGGGWRWLGLSFLAFLSMLLVATAFKVPGARAGAFSQLAYATSLTLLAACVLFPSSRSSR